MLRSIIPFLLIPVIVFGEKSLTLVIDTTVSMKNDIDVINRYFGIVTQAVKENKIMYIDNYVLVPFSYPDVENPFKTRSSDEFKKALGRLSANGGLTTECPENTLSGIQRALEISDRESKLFIFTDADARDYEKLDTIKELCERTKSQVTIFLSGSCVQVGQQRLDSRGLDVYRDIAAACSGMMMQLELPNLRHAFKYMRELVTENWTENKLEKVLTGNQIFTFPINKQIKAVMIAATGDFPSNLEVTNAEGERLQLQWIVETRNAVVVRILNLQTTEIKINIRSRSETTMMIHSRTDFPIQYGFSTHVPRSLRETSRKPIPGNLNHILLVVPNDSDIHITAAEITYSDGSLDTKISLSNIGTRLYLGNNLFEPNKQFNMNIYYTRDSDIGNFKITTATIEPQPETVRESIYIKPEVEILDEDQVVKYESDLVLACHVIGYPRPVISWNDNDVQNDYGTVLLEMPSVFINYSTLTNITKNGTYYCQAENVHGNDSKSIQVSVQRDYSIQLIQTPEDKTIEYGTEATFVCEAKTYPAALIKWYHNDDIVYSPDEIPAEYVYSVFTIKNMSMNDVGSYTCDITNNIESRRISFNVDISGVEVPEIEKNVSSVTLVSGNRSELECRVVKGMPEPRITWKFKADETQEFNEVPYDIYQNGRILQFSEVKPENYGIYRCEATNIAGTAYQDIDVTVLHAPVFVNDGESHSIKVREGKEVVLPCDVNGNPPPTVHWEKVHEYETVPIDDKYKTMADDDYAIKFDARWNDSGEYHCVAENSVGKSHSVVFLEVLVSPYIESPPSKVMVVRRGQSVTIPCNVLYGNPTPRITWEINVARKTVLTDITTLHYDNVTPQQEGFYTCVATNTAGSDNIKIYLKVTA